MWECESWKMLDFKWCSWSRHPSWWSSRDCLLCDPMELGSSSSDISFHESWSLLSYHKWDQIVSPHYAIIRKKQKGGIWEKEWSSYFL